MTVVPLRLIDGDGVVVEDPAATIRALEAALVRLEKSNRALKAQLNANREKARKAHAIDDAFLDWRDKLVAVGRKGMARAKLSPDRIDAMAAMFEAGYTLDDFRLVASGIAAAQFVVYGKRRQTGSDDARELDIAYVCKEARRFEEAARIGALAERAREDASA